MSGRDPVGPPAALPQPVLTPLTGSAIFLVLVIEPGGEEAVRGVLADLAGLQRAVGFRYPEGGLACVAGVGSAAWDRLYRGPRPAGLHRLPEFAGPRHRSVSTDGDVLLHIRARQLFLCFELATQILKRLSGVVTVVDEVHGFKYWDERDLLGFVDGTENPTGPTAQAAVTVTAEQDPAFPGASYVVVQKYLHDLASWDALSVEEQGTGDRTHQTGRHRDGRRRQAAQFARRREHDRGPGRHAATDRARQHALWASRVR